MIIIAKWQVDDRYVGSRPHETQVDTEMFMSDEEWSELSEEEKKDKIDECIQEDFNSRIYFYVTDYGI